MPRPIIIPALTATFVLATSPAAHAQMQAPSLARRTLDPATLRPPARTTVPARGTTVPLTPGMRPMVDVMVNGQGPFHFMVETTGAALELNSATRDRLGLRPRTAGTHLTVADVDSIRIGDAVLEGMTAVSVDGLLGGDVDGILGLSALADLLVTVEAAAGTMTLAKGALPAANGRNVLPLVPVPGYWGANHLWGVEIGAGGTRAVATLTLQSPGGVGTSPALAATAPFAAAPVAIGRVLTPLQGAVDRRVARLDGDLRIGAYTLRRPLVNVIPGPAQFPASWTLGAAVLRNFAITFDQKNRLVRLARADTSPIAAPPAIRDFGFDASPPRTPGGGPYAVRFVIPGSPADRAGVREGDVLVSADGRDAASLDRSGWAALAARTDAVSFRFRRDGAEREVSLTNAIIVQ
ncbi:MAG TPA: aspartyl protease family protein [Longimicrobium sp.]|nr:aspartyl protease family protein [Longimicrobium sp.]